MFGSGSALPGAPWGIIARNCRALEDRTVKVMEYGFKNYGVQFGPRTNRL